MSYKIMEDGRCLNNHIDTIDRAKYLAEDYATEADVGMRAVTIVDESTGKTVMTGRTEFFMKWTDAP